MFRSESRKDLRKMVPTAINELLQEFTSQERRLQTDPMYNGPNYAAKFVIHDHNTISTSTTRVNDTPKTLTPINLSTTGDQSSIIDKIMPPPPPYNPQSLMTAEQYLQSLQMAANKRLILNSPLNQMRLNTSPIQHLPLHITQEGINLQNDPEVITNEIPEYQFEYDHEYDQSQNQNEEIVSLKKNMLLAILGNLDVTWSILKIAMLEQRTDMLTVIPMIENLVKSSIDGIMNLANIEKNLFNMAIKSILPPPPLQQIRTVQGHGRMSRSKMRNIQRASSNAIPFNSFRNNCARNQQGVRGEHWGYYRAQAPNSALPNLSSWDPKIGQPQYNPLYHPCTRNAYHDLQQSQIPGHFQPQAASTPGAEGLCHQFGVRTDPGGNYSRPSQAQYNQHPGRDGRGGKAQGGVRRSGRNSNKNKTA